MYTCIFFSFSLKYPRRRRLYYLYPPPSPSILANISNALAACPKLYVQVHACAFVSVPLCLFCKCVFVDKQTVLGETILVNAAFVPSDASLSSSSSSSSSSVCVCAGTCKIAFLRQRKCTAFARTFWAVLISLLTFVQVLHLMNKMDLPAPFGPVTAQPPLVSRHCSFPSSCCW